LHIISPKHLEKFIPGILVNKCPSGDRSKLKLGKIVVVHIFTTWLAPNFMINVMLMSRGLP
jgi:hypothetical protein